MGFFDSLLSAATLGVSDLITDLVSSPTQIWSENRSVNNQKELIDHQTGRTKELQEHQAQLGKDVYNYTFGQEKSLNYNLMQNGAGIQKQSLIDAGINPASNFGSFSGNLAQSSAPAYSASASAGNAPFSQVGSISELASGMTALEEAKLIKEQARSLRLKNDAEEEENLFYQKFDEYYDWDVQNGKVIIKPIDPEMKIPDVFTNRPKTRKGVEARHLTAGRLMAEKSHLKSVTSQAELENAINEGRLKDNNILRAMIRMPDKDYDKVVEEIENLKKDKAIKQLQFEYDQKRNNFELPEQQLQILEHKIKESTNIRLILDKFTDGSWSIGDLIYLLCAVSFK